MNYFFRKPKSIKSLAFLKCIKIKAAFYSLAWMIANVNVGAVQPMGQVDHLHVTEVNSTDTHPIIVSDVLATIQVSRYINTCPSY